MKVADIFMGGGTTIVEGSRLGMQMVGNDLNPVAWFVVKQELANVNLDEVRKLLEDIEAEVKPTCRISTATAQTEKKENGRRYRQTRHAR